MSFLEVFLEGLRKGLRIGVWKMLPTLMAAFAIVEILSVSGFLKLLGGWLSPLMIPFGLPGEAMPVLLCAWITAAGGIGLVASLFVEGSLNATHVAILAPALLLMGSQIQYMGRVLSVAGVENRHIPVCMAISILNALIAMLFMRFFIV